MAERHMARFIGLWVFVFVCSAHLLAQPSLPDLAGTFAKGYVSLTWNCQYNGVKAISVLRSADSVNNYEIIGYVKNTEKGVQTFDDMHPGDGKNYYKLSIIFSSGLKWHSNHIGVAVPYIEKRLLESDYEKKLPEQRISATSQQSTITTDTCTKDTKRQARPTVSLTEDTTQHVRTAPPRPKIVLHQGEDDADLAPPVCIRSGLVFTDSVTGHVDMNLPDDVTGHRYSVKFYDLQNHLLFDVAKITAQKIIFDRRNFQRRGVYKFVLRKDYTELETGYFILGK